MLLRLKPLILSSLVLASSINFSQAVADDVCSYDILRIKLGMTKEEVTNIMLEQGFGVTGVISHRGIMHFGKDDTERWPPEGVEITAEQAHVINLMKNPDRKAGIEKRAETDPKMKQLLAEIAKLPPIPELKDSTTVIVSLGATPSSNRKNIILSINETHHFPGDIYHPPEPKDFQYSASHKILDNNRWQRHCAVNMQDNQPFTDNDGTHTRTCNYRSNSVDRISITIIPNDRQAGKCRYAYQSTQHKANESLNGGYGKYQAPTHERSGS